MPQRSNAFQQLITLLHQQLDDRAVVTESKMLRDQRTGDNREVDIVIDARSGGYPISIGVECIDHKRKASVEWVERMWAKHQDLHTDKIVLVSRSGFARNASAKADELGIVTLSLDNAAKADWTRIAGKLDSVYLDVVESKWHVYAVVIRDNDEEEAVPIGRDVLLFNKDQSLSATVGGVVDNIVASPEVGKLLLERMHNENLKEKQFAADYSFHEYIAALDSSGVERPIAKLRIVFDSVRTQTAVDLVSGSILGSQVAYGEGKGEAGRIRVAVIEREGQEPITEVLKQSGSKWKPFVDVDRSTGSQGG